MVECLFCVHLHLSNPKLTPLGVRHPTKQYRMFTPSFLYFFLDVDVTPEDPQIGQGRLQDAQGDFGAT